jgi:hypothetical protein
MLVFLTSVSLLAFTYARAAPSRRALAAWVIASALSLATHYYAVLAVAPQAIWLLAIHRHRRPVRLAVAVVALCGLALIPLALSQHGNGRSNWIAHAPLGRRLREIGPQFAIGFGSPAYSVLEPLAVAIAIFALVLLLTRTVGSERRGGLVAAGLTLAGLALSLILVAAGADDLITRNVLAVWLPAALAVSAGLAAGRARLPGLVAAIVLCGIGVAATVGIAVDRSLERPDWRVVARALGHRPGGTAGRGGRVILIQHYRDLLPLSLYLPGLRFMMSAREKVSEFDVVSFTSPPSSGFCWWGSACNLWPSRIQPSYPIRGFRAVWERRALQFTVLHMEPTGRPAVVTSAEIARVLRRTRFRNDELLFQR